MTSLLDSLRNTLEDAFVMPICTTAVVLAASSRMETDSVYFVRKTADSNQVTLFHPSSHRPGWVSMVTSGKWMYLISRPQYHAKTGQRYLANTEEALSVKLFHIDVIEFPELPFSKRLLNRIHHIDNARLLQAMSKHVRHLSYCFKAKYLGKAQDSPVKEHEQPFGLPLLLLLGHLWKIDILFLMNKLPRDRIDGPAAFSGELFRG